MHSHFRVLLTVLPFALLSYKGVKRKTRTRFRATKKRAA